MIVRAIVAQGEAGGPDLASELSVALNAVAMDRLDVAVAYATQSGLNILRDLVGEWPPATRWVVGLDDAITQPEAIDSLDSLPGAELRLAELGPQRRFHPKLYCFWSSTEPAACIAAVGSANMTEHGLKLNGEATVILEAESEADADQLKKAWEALNAFGTPAAQMDLDAYRAKYARARNARRRMANRGILPPQPEAEEEVAAAPVVPSNPSNAMVAWTEGASPSAGGRDLEFPRAMMPYFRLPSSPATRRFRIASGPIFPLTFTMREDNQMWRLLISRAAISAGIGRENLRPVAGSTNRSDLAVVFRRAEGPADYDVEFVLIDSPEHTALLTQTQAAGTLDRTRDPGGRYFGYF